MIPFLVGLVLGVVLGACWVVIAVASIEDHGDFPARREP